MAFTSPYILWSGHIFVLYEPYIFTVLALYQVYILTSPGWQACNLLSRAQEGNVGGLLIGLPIAPHSLLCAIFF